MKKLCFVLLLSAVASLGTYRFVRSHCEIPCGIYGDTTRIALLHEHIATIEKSMKQIQTLPEQEPINANQIVRWVGNKEEHCNKVQHIVTQYFMTQRVKPKSQSDGAAYTKYIKQLTALHGMLIHAMKAKQTTDVSHCAALRKLVGEFAAAYLSEEDLKHIRSEHGK